MQTGNENDDSLNKLLRSWQPQVDIPSDFQRNVWQRIEAREEESPVTWWRIIADWMTQGLSHPVRATAVLVAVSLVAGGMGAVQARDSAAALELRMESRYTASINPYAQADARQVQP
ncbi:MAG: hypothetical protein ACAI35_24180 [Candidatus Methylacidiphilales bacterium]|nr:hypothetical protein [Candidatus Methylacidiphilales bacterium]